MAIFLLVAGAACGPVAPAEDCFVGVWEDPGAACDLRCDAGDPPSICDASDCRLMSFLAFNADGEYWLGSYLHSASRRTFAWFTPPKLGAWRGGMSEGVEVRSPSAESFSTIDLVCREDGAITISRILYQPTPPEVAAAMRETFDAGMAEVTY